MKKFRHAKAWFAANLLGRIRRQRISVTKIPGGLIIGDLDGFGTEERPPTQADLDALIGDTTRVAVREPFEPEKKPLFQTSDGADLASLREALRIHDGGIGHCMCFGSLELAFWCGTEAVGSVTIHHGESLRWQPFFENAALVEPERILDWLSERGISSLRDEYEENRREHAESERRLEQWLHAMPPVLEPLWESMCGFSCDWPDVAGVLAEHYPDPVLRARTLMEWLGHGAGRWSGFPSYEEVPEWCLLQMPLEVLVEAALGEPRSEQLLEGAARLFASWEFWQERKLELAGVPGDLKRELLQHALESDDEDKRSRALAAFGQ